MPVIAVGATEIPYEIKRSPRARRMRITVRPGGVQVVAPRFARRAAVMAFVESKARWVHAKTQALSKRTLVAAPERFVSGARVPFRGRFLELRLEAVDSRRASLRLADDALDIRVPRELSEMRREQTARRLVMAWLKEEVRADAWRWVERYRGDLGACPTRIRVGNQKTLWGSCSTRGTVSLNWRLIGVPTAVFEYVVVHELCHLVEHNHGARFWQLVAELLPDYRERRAWLERRGVALG